MGGYLFSNKRLFWSGLTMLLGDTLRTAGDITTCVTSAYPIYMFLTSNTGSKKYYLWKKKWLIEKLTFFYNWEFSGILNRLCMEPIRRSYDFLSLTLAVVASTSGNCYFLLQCRCQSVYVLCVFVVSVWRVKWVNQKRFDVFYYNKHNLISY